jgi:hypothetical protein
MAQIQMTPELSAALIARMQAEYGQQALSNFALDILLDSANAEIARLVADGARKDELNATLQKRALDAEAQVETYKQANDPHRATVMSAAERVRHARAERRGSNSNTV